MDWEKRKRHEWEWELQGWSRCPHPIFLPSFTAKSLSVFSLPASSSFAPSVLKPTPAGFHFHYFIKSTAVKIPNDLHVARFNDHLPGLIRLARSFSSAESTSEHPLFQYFLHLDSQTRPSPGSPTSPSLLSPCLLPLNTAGPKVHSWNLFSAFTLILCDVFRSRCSFHYTLSTPNLYLQHQTAPLNPTPF